jgi:hypothetical protein
MTQQVSIPRLRPVIRVFVSSTFSDMKHERNALEADAFPKLEQLCQRQGFQFQAIDLRWGVSTEAGLDHRTMRICFDELRRAQEISPRPNLLILLGNRYGWRPLPEEISVEEFHTLEHAAAQIPGSADKSAVAVLGEWYREDTNAVPPVCLLQSRRQDLGDNQDYTDDAVWNRVQAVLWTIINRAMPPEQLQRRFDGAAADGSPPAIVRFQASATEQEIWHGALRVPDAREHVLAFFREIENLAAFSDPKQITDFVDVDPSGRVTVALQTEQDRLKAELRQRLGSSNVFRNEVPVRFVEPQNNQGGRTADVTTDHLAQLCADVVNRLSEIIQGQIDEYWRNTARASTDRAARELEIEQREYERFAQERGGEESFVGRQVELQAILDYVGSDSRWPLVIHGASGCGKTALLARASQEVAKTRKRIERFIGVAPRSSDLRSLLSSLCQDLRQRTPHADPLPTEINKLRDEFSHHLQAATPEQPLILFLDALDQLGDADNGRLLHWLPLGSLPAHVKVVVSCLSDRAAGDPAGQPYAELKRRQIPAENFINLDVLSEAEARLLLFDRWLSKGGRKLNDGQRARIEERLASPACCQPIFLKLLFEEVQLWHSYDPATAPGESVPALLGQLFDRLSQPTNHGPLLVNRVLGYLSASRHGLAENELLEILFADPEYRAKLNETTEQTQHELPPNAKRIPVALWSRLRFDLAPYLTERAAPGANVLAFYHGQFRESAATSYLSSQSHTLATHERLATYFENKPHWVGLRKLPMDPGSPATRKMDELPWQQSQAHQPERLARLLLDVAFLEAKIAANMPFDLLEDFRRLEKLCGEFQNPSTEIRELFRESLVLWRVLSNILDQVTVDPTSIGMQLGLELQNIGAASASQPREGGLIRRLDRATNDRPCFSRFCGSTGVPYLAQTALRHTYVHLLRFSADSGRLLYADAEGQLVQWNWSAPGIQQTQGPTTSNCCGAVVVSDQSVVMAGSNEAWMFSCQSLWDERFCDGTWQQILTSKAGANLGAVASCPRSGTFLVSEVRTDIGHIVRFRGNDRIQSLRMPYVGAPPPVNCITVNSSEQLTAVGFGDGTLAISTGFCAVVHPGGINACVFLEKDMEIATIGADGVLAIRSLEGVLRREVNLIQGTGTCLAYCSQHRLIVVGHRNGYISVEPDEGSAFEFVSGFWPGVRGQVSSLCFSPCGTYLASAGSNGVVRVFESDAVRQACETTSIGQRGFPAGPINDVRFCDRSNDLVFLDRNHKVRTDSPTADSRYLPFGCNCFCIDQARDRIVAARHDDIHFLTPSTGKPESCRKIGGAEKHSMTISSDGRFMALIENDRLFIYEISDHEPVILQRLDLPLTQFLAVQTLPLNRAPLRFCRNGKLLAVPLESTVLESQYEHREFIPDLRRNLLFVEVPSGQIVGSIGYRGFCTALDEIPERDILIVGLGRGVVHVGSQEVICESPKDAILFFSIEEGRCLQSRRLIAEDLGVMGVAVERETHFKGCIVVAFESGRIRLTSLHSDCWAASICLPDPAVGVRFRHGIVQVADSGARRGNWPALNQFTLHFPIAK